MSSQPNIVGYCRACGKPLDSTNVRTAHGTIYCEEHLPVEPVIEPRVVDTTAYPAAAPAAATAGASAYSAAGAAAASPYPTYSSPYTPRVPPPLHQSDVSPGLAFVLGLIPGVGAIYNCQYAKGLIHVIIIGLMISILSSGTAGGLEPLMGLLLAGFWAYMAFEAYHTARRRQLGQGVDEFSSLFPMRGGSKFPAAPIVLMVLGLIFLLNNLEILELRRILRYWPVVLIGIGAYMLYVRLATAGDEARGGGQ
jgi:hypothetical protein